MRLAALYLVLALVLTSACQDADDGIYEIEGKVLTVDDEFPYVIASRFDPITQERTPVDTATLDEEGHFTLSFLLEQPDLFQLRFPDRQTVTILCEPGDDMEVTAEGKRGGSLEISGSHATDLLLGYDEFRNESNQRLIKPAYAAMTEASKEEDQQAEIDAVEAYVDASTEHRRELLEYSAEHIGTSPALYGTVLRWTGDDEISRLDELVANFAAEHPDLTMTEVMQEKVDRYRTVAIGAEIPALIQANPEGEMIDIRDHLGAYTLIDFWASWCRPCILQIPDIHQALDTYGDQGFKVFGVSFDSDADKWKEAIEKYDLDWPHVSDVKGWQSQQAKDFNVTFVPFNILVDQDGVIVAKNLHSLGLLGMLEDLLKENS